MDYLDLLYDPAYRHMLLNHIPIAGLAVAWLVLATGVLIRQHACILLGLGLVAMTCGVGLLVARFGDAAYPAIYDTLNGHSRAWLDYHAEVAEQWLPLILANAAFALAGFILGGIHRRLLIAIGCFLLITSLGALAATGLIARSGGQIQHPEFRIETTPPTI